MKNTRFAYAIVYKGAPFGDNEHGEIISRHTSLANAQKAWNKNISGSTGIYNHIVVKLDQNGDYNRFRDKISKEELFA